MTHRWSGWPGAWCLDCGKFDPMEQALADGKTDAEGHLLPEALAEADKARALSRAANVTIHIPRADRRNRDRRRLSMAEITYGRTSEGQILYDLAFTNLSAKYLARKHRWPIADIRRLRETASIKKLRKQNRLRASCG